jgi:phage baseplate assembly protein W
MPNFMGISYPVLKTAKGFFYIQSGSKQIKSDLLQLLLTNPGERVMNPFFGTPLKKLVFDQNDATLQDAAREMIIQSIQRWEPRIVIQEIECSNQPDRTVLNKYDDYSNINNILFIRILFVEPDNIKEVQELVLEIPLAGVA